jgi:endoglucanase
MKIILSTLLFVSVITAQGQAFWANTAFVKRENQNIVDSRNKPIKLNGVNLGGWLTWEGWIWGGGFTQEKKIFKGIENKLGREAAENFRDAVYANFITRQDIKKIADQCFNTVRIPFNHTILEDDNTPFVYKNSRWLLLDSVLKWCEDYDVYAILDLHAAPGGQSTLFTADPDPMDLWASKINQNRTIQLWKAIAKRYNNRGIIAGYDLLNEPNLKLNELLINFYTSLIDSIRTVDKNHMLFIEGNNYAQDFSMFNYLPDENMAFEFHIYTWFSSLSKSLEKYKVLSKKIDVPVWCGEWGENTLGILKKTINEFHLPVNNISGNAFWTFKKQSKTFQFPCYQCFNKTKLWNKITKWLENNNEPEPSNEDMRKGISEFINNIKTQNTTCNNSLKEVLSNCSNHN